MRFRSVALLALLALPVVIGCKKKDPPPEPDPAAASALTSVPITGANTIPTAPPVMAPDEPIAATDAGTAGQRKRRSVKGQHAKE